MNTEQSSSTEQPPERWAIVEIMGRRELAGRIHGDPPFGSGIIVDIPLEDGKWAQEFYGNAAIFGVRLVPEASARAFAARSWHVKSTYPLALAAPAADHEGREAARPAGATRLADRDVLYQEIDERLASGAFEIVPDDDDSCGWMEHIKDGLDEAWNTEADDHANYRRRLRNVAAWAIGAIEAHDRAQEDEDDEDDDPEFGADEPHAGPADQDDLPL